MRCLRLYPEMDIVVKAAAVADYRPVETAPQKIKKGKEGTVLHLARTDDILEILGKKKRVRCWSDSLLKRKTSSTPPVPS